ncbi:MAG: undecaprenyldiphospho-muramoylpentapeptide beta-N-acetylglucosaminyltransferase [Rhodospirillaceae bacterium]
MSRAPHVVLAAGGTGGHIFPAIAVAEELLARGYEVSLVTDRRGQGFGSALPQVAVHRIRASGIGRGIVGKLSSAASIAAGVLQARRLLTRLRPVCVVGFGGYPSVPTMIAATSRGIPSIVHEQNAVLGRANRLVAPRVSAIATSFADTAFVRDEDRAKTVLTGNPVRGAFSAARREAFPPIGPNGEGLRVLVLGGSQGARILSDVVPRAFAEMPPTLRRRFAVTQQCRPEDMERVAAAYAAAGMNPVLAPFFDDVPDRMAAAHVVIARAGASTVAELAEAGRPAILVPYPHATDDHQTANARAMEAAGGAWLIPQTAFAAETLIIRLEGFVNLPDGLRRAAEKMRAAGGRNAAAAVAGRVEALAGTAPVRGAGPVAERRREVAA